MRSLHDALPISPGVVPYTVSKAGVKHLTKVLALELARFGIRVNAIAPGYIATDLNRDFLASDAGQRLRSRVPSQRFGEQHELDGALLLLASKAGAYISGTEIVVDGGHTCKDRQNVVSGRSASVRGVRGGSRLMKK